MNIKTNIQQLITILLGSMRERKKWILTLSCLVVFITTYLLILPAFTLDKEEASEQGGIDVPGVEQSAEADEVAEDLAKVSSEDNEKKESAEESSEGVEKEEFTRTAAEKTAKTSKTENSKSVAKKKSAEITLENDESDDFSVAVESKEAVLSEDMSVAVREIDKSDKKQKNEYDSLYNDALEAVQKAQEEEGLEKPSDFAFAKFYDISLMDGDTEVEPGAAVDVKISFNKDLQKELKVADPEKVHIVHFIVDKESGEVTPEVLDTKSTDITVENKKVTDAAFTTDSFSVFGVVYTVDFHWNVDGKEYDFSLPGGGFISLKSLVAALKVTDNSDAFITNIEKAEFSNTELVWIGKTDNDTTVGELKKANGLEPEYSTELTKEKIAETDAKTIKAGEWVLISLKPFASEETMTVTMKDGEVFTIKVTDNQATDPLGLDGEAFIITNNAHNRALQMSTYTLNVSAQTPSSDENDIWKFEYDKNAFNGHGGYYLVCTVNNVEYYLNVDNGQLSVTTTKFLPEGEEPGSGTKTASPFTVEFDTNALRYRISASSDGNSAFLGISNSGITLDNSKQDRNLVSLRNPGSGGNTPGTIGTWDIKSDGIALKLFDYSGYMAQWHQNNPYNPWAGGYWEQTNNEIDGQWAPGDLNQLREGDGINYHRSLLFSGSGISGSSETFNNFTGSRPNNTGYYSGYARQDIVNYNLGDDRFPVLRSENVQNGTLDVEEGGSLAYLFDDNEQAMDSHSGQYAKRVYDGADGTGLDGLLRKDDEGYYYYDSEQNYARLVDNEVILYSDTYKKKDGDSQDVKTRKIGLFPFTDYDSSRTEEKSPNSNYYDHQFGMTIATDFVYPENGIVPDTSHPMVFEFSGDDDVWVFVDGVLVLDLGGVHQPISGKIDFSSGAVTITEFGSDGVEYTSDKSTTIDAMFAKASQEANKTITFDKSEYSTHKLEFFYLERGGCDSNCKIKFNLVTTKSVTLEKKLEGLSEDELEKYEDQHFTFQFCKKNSNLVRPLTAYNTGDTENFDTEKNHTVRRGADGNVIEEGFPIKDGLIDLKPGETVTISMLPATAEFHVAEVDQTNMAAYETPTGEKYYKEEKQDDIVLTEQYACSPIETTNSWVSDTYAVSDTDKVVIINRPLSTDLKVKKVWTDGNEIHNNDTIKFTVQATIPGEGTDAAPVPYEVSDIKDKVFEINEAGGWQKTFENLPASTPAGKPITYTVTEQQLSEYTSVVTKEGSLYTITNTPKAVDFEIIKVDKDHNETKLPDAEFTLRKVSPVSPFEYIEDESKAIKKTTNADGIASFNGLTKGYYEVKETKLPAGYINTGEDAFYIHVSVGEAKMVVKNNGSWSEVESSSDGKFTFKAASENDLASITVENEPGHALPHTGGVGTTIFYIIGTMLVLGCGIYFIARKRIIN